MIDEYTLLFLSLSIITYEELSDLGSTLGTETLRDSGISQTGNILLTLLNNNERQDREVRADDTTTDRLSLAFTGTARTVTRVTLGHQETNTVRQKDTLLHGETLLIVTTRDTENVTLELVTERVTGDLLGHTLIIETTAILYINDQYLPLSRLYYRKQTLTDDVRLQFQSIFDSQWLG
jgi:hypothetical protein